MRCFNRIFHRGDKNILIVFFLFSFSFFILPSLSKAQDKYGSFLSLPEEVCQGAEFSVALDFPGIESGSFEWVLPEGWRVRRDSLQKQLLITAGNSSGSVQVICKSELLPNEMVLEAFIKVNPAPEPVLSAPDSVCVGEEVAVSSNLPCSWEIPQGWDVLNQTDSNLVARAGSVGGVIQAVTKDAFCVRSARKQIRVTSKPFVFGNDKNVCHAGEVVFQAIGPEEDHYTWYVSSGEEEQVDRGGPDAYDKPEFSTYITQNTTLYFVYDNGVGCRSDFMPVTITIGPGLAQTQDFDVHAGEPARLYAWSDDKYDNYGYHWYASWDLGDTTVIGSDQVLVTDALYADTTFYVALVDPFSHCEGPRVPVRASISTSAVVTSALQPSFSGVRIISSPNPFQDYTTLNLNYFPEVTAVYVSSMSGETVEVIQDPMSSQVLGANLPTGMYSVRVISPGRVEVLKIVKN